MNQELRKEYKKTIKEFVDIEARIEELEEKKEVKEYKLLISKRGTKRADLEGLKRAMDYSTMDECSHLYVLSKSEFIEDGYGVLRSGCPLCIKCGFDFGVSAAPYDLLNQKQILMLDILRKNGDLPKGRYLKDDDCSTIKCPSPTIAIEIYEEINRAYPNISDDDTEILFREKLKERQKVKSKN